MPQIETLVSDIYKLFETGTVFEGERLSKFSGQVGSLLVNRFEEYSKERNPTLRLSNVGQPLRKLWYEIKSGLKPEPLTPETKFKFIYGDLIELFVLFLAEQAGHEVTDLQKKVEVDNVRGSIDCRIDGHVVDVKSCSPISFSKFKSGSIRQDDPFGYMAQLSGYVQSLDENHGYFLPVDKVNGHICLFKLTEEDVTHVNIKERIERARDALNSDVPPADLCYETVPIGKSGNYGLPPGCSYCNHKWNCHTGLREFIYSSGPVFLTKVERVPAVFEVSR